MLIILNKYKIHGFVGYIAVKGTIIHIFIEGYLLKFSSQVYKNGRLVLEVKSIFKIW